MVEASPSSEDSSPLETADHLPRARAGDENARADLPQRYRPVAEEMGRGGIADT